MRVRGGNRKFRALRLDHGNFAWASEREFDPFIDSWFYLDPHTDDRLPNLNSHLLTNSHSVLSCTCLYDDLNWHCILITNHTYVSNRLCPQDPYHRRCLQFNQQWVGTNQDFGQELYCHDWRHSFQDLVRKSLFSQHWKEETSWKERRELIN